ncbi:MAG: helix-turn-helix transcriptional regulator [Clostridia bacterium]|nr:helix-turn-helix transcriptional regulator [Clostridia bacterium]
MEQIKQIIAKNIVDLRHSKDITQSDLAAALNYSDKAVSKWERAESLPDVTVLIQIAQYFEVSLDYLVTAEHKSKKEKLKIRSKITLQNHGLITAISLVLVWLIAAIVYVVLDPIINYTNLYILTFVYAIPVTFIVWLVFNAVWFNSRRNFLIISLLMWSVLASLYVTLLMFGGINIWTVFGVGAIGQLIIILWSKIKRKKNL